MKLLNCLSKRNGREKFLIFMLLSVVAFFWISSCVQQGTSLLEDWQAVSKKTEKQLFWIKNKETVHGNLEKVLSSIDPAKSLSGAAFSGEVETLICPYKVSYSMDSPSTRREDMFDAHTLQLHCENITMEDLIAFEKGVYGRKPYLSLEKIKLRANAFDPQKLEAECSFNALQLKKVSRE